MSAQRGISPYVDACTIDCITDEHARFFHDKGFLVVRNLVGQGELQRLQEQTRAHIQQRNKGPDYWYNDEIPDNWYTNYKDVATDNNSTTQQHQTSGEVKKGTPFRIEYPVDKLPSCVSLLGHPFLLRSIEKLQGPNFIPTWDSLVFKEEGEGVPIKWHRDASAESIGKFLLCSLFQRLTYYQAGSLPSPNQVPKLHFLLQWMLVYLLCYHIFTFHFALTPPTLSRVFFYVLQRYTLMMPTWSWAIAYMSYQALILGLINLLPLWFPTFLIMVSKRGGLTIKEKKRVMPTTD